MRLFTLLVSCFAIVSTSYAQDSKVFQLNGEFAEQPNTGFRVHLKYGPTNRLEGAFVAEGQTDAKGNFSSEFEVSEGQACSLMIGQKLYFLWAEPAKDVTISIGKSGVRCTGSLSAQNQFLFDIGLADPHALRTNKKFEARDCLSSLDARKESQLEKLNETQEEFGNDSRFVRYVRAQIIGVSATSKNSQAMKAIGKKEIAKSDLPADYFDFWDSVPILDDSAAMLSRQYQSALQGKFSYIAKQELTKKGIDPVKAQVHFYKVKLKAQFDLLVDQPKTNEMMFASQIMLMIQYAPRKGTVEVMGDFANKFPSSPYLALINNSFNKTHNIDFAKVDEACEFRNAKGAKVSFADLSDKVIYVDFWGLWCKACMQQQPDFKSVVEKFSNNDEIVFLSLNFLDDQEQWLAHIRSKNPQGLHWKPASKEDEAKAYELFSLDAFPRYMIIGKNGKLISASGPTPSNPDLEKLLDKATK